ncbi:hypothetical protein ASF88_17345 [Leifsonia sp. Leaf336]|nr:hypothetical protein ASF88_17345 [Leifsonia sp. Leaf336]
MAEPAARRLPGLSVRIKLTLSYAGFLVLAAIALLAVTWYVLRFVPQGNLQIIGADVDQGWAPNRADLIEAFVPVAIRVLVLVAVVGFVGGWFLAGRMLKPLSAIDRAARRIADGDLGHRVQLPGRADEFRTLSDAFDLMLDRVEQQVGEQQRFAANASHELRTPLAMTRTILDVASADPDTDVEMVFGRLAEINERAIASTESLLLLARLGRSSVEVPAVEIDLESLTARVVDTLAASATRSRVTISTTIEAPTACGNESLIERLLSNLVHNAIVHNVGTDRRVWITVAADASSATTLTVENTGRPVEPSVVASLVEPFERGRSRTRATDGSHVGAGLGLAICASIARVHGGDLRLIPRDGGGLRVVATWPGPSS